MGDMRMKSEMGSEDLLFLIELAKASHLKPYELLTVLYMDETDELAKALEDCLEIGLLWNSQRQL
jgi:hypothetical protein